MMNTQEVANKWAQMCRKGNHLECIEKLYGDDVISKEMPGVPEKEIVSGKQNVLNKAKKWLESVSEVHHETLTSPVVADNHFTSKMTFDVTFKDRGRQQMEEIAVFEVNNGKIVNEQFFYSM